MKPWNRQSLHLLSKKEPRRGRLLNGTLPDEESMPKSNAFRSLALPFTGNIAYELSGILQRINLMQNLPFIMLIFDKGSELCVQRSGSF